MLLMPIEKRIVKVLEKHVDLTTRDLMKKSDVGHSTFYKWIKRLEIDHKLITHYKIKNQVHYILKKPDEMSIDEEVEFTKKSFENMEMVINSALNKNKKKSQVELIDAYELSFQTLFGYNNLMNFSLLHANYKTLPDHVANYIKHMKSLLKKITLSMDRESKNQVFSRLQKHANDLEDQLRKIEKIKK